MSKTQEKSLETLRRLYQRQGIAEDEIELLIGEQRERFIKQREADVKAKQDAEIEAERIRNLPKLETLISRTDLEKMKALVIQRDEARDVLKTASVESYIEAMRHQQDTTMAVLEFSHAWVQDVPKDLELFKVNNRQYSIKQRNNGVKYIGYKTQKEIEL